MATPFLPSLAILDESMLESIKVRLDDPTEDDKELVQALSSLVSSADEWLGYGPWSVTSKATAGPSGDIHDYVSQAPYWWPSQTDSTLYVRRDGQRNPEVYHFSDRWGAECVMQSTPLLVLAWYYTRMEKYAQHAARILYVWFLDSSSRMNPHLQNAQMIPGQNTGRSIGIIDFAQGYTELLDAIAILSRQSAPGWSPADTQTIVAWNEAFLRWLRESDFGRAESAESNNHGDFASLLKAGIAKFLGKNELAREEVELELERIASGVDADGAQPKELARTRSWHYSTFRLIAVTRMAAIASNLGCDMWSAHDHLVRRAVDFLVPYAVAPALWPYEELDFHVYAANDIIRAAADAGSVVAQEACLRLPKCPRGDLWPIRPAPQQLDCPPASPLRALCR